MLLGSFGSAITPVPPANDHVNDAKTSSNNESPAKQALDLFGRGVGGHIEVFGAQTHQQVAHGATHHVSLETGLVQGAHHVDSAFIYQVRVNAVGGNGHVHPFAKIGLFARGGCGCFTQEAVDKFFDHGFSDRHPIGCLVQHSVAGILSKAGAFLGAKQLKYAPSALLRHGTKTRVGVGGHGHIYFFQERQIVG